MRSTVLLILASSVVASWAPVSSADSLPRSTPEAEGISSAAIHRFVDHVEENFDALHSFMLVRHGKVVAEGWWSPYAAEEPHQLNSLTKMFLSTAMGLAVTEGRLSLEDPVIRFFPEQAPAQPSPYLKAMRVRDLLIGGTGHSEQVIRSSMSAGEQDDRVKAFLALPVSHPPGTYFAYNPPASLMLSAIIEKATGQSLRAYLAPRLFEPLGMADPIWSTWGSASTPGSVRTEDLAKMGLLHLQKGQWGGKPILPEAWIESASTAQISTESWVKKNLKGTTTPNLDWEQGYGYQLWPCRYGFYRGDGAGGQFSIVMPQYDAVIAITAGLTNMQDVMNTIWEMVVPAFQDGPLPEDELSAHRLLDKLGGLQLRTPLQAHHARSPKLPTPRYTFPENPDGIESIALEPITDASGVAVVIRLSGADQRILIGQDVWEPGALTTGAEPRPIAASGAWTADDTYTFNLCHYQTVFCGSYRLQFSDHELRLHREADILNARGFMPMPLTPPEIIGKAEL